MSHGDLFCLFTMKVVYQRKLVPLMDWCESIEDDNECVGRCCRHDGYLLRSPRCCEKKSRPKQREEDRSSKQKDSACTPAVVHQSPEANCAVNATPSRTRNTDVIIDQFGKYKANTLRGANRMGSEYIAQRIIASSAGSHPEKCPLWLVMLTKSHISSGSPIRSFQSVMSKLLRPQRRGLHLERSRTSKSEEGNLGPGYY